MNAVALAPHKGASSNGIASNGTAQEDNEIDPTEHRGGRGGYRAGSGRPRMAAADKRTRMSVGLTGANLQWLREQARVTDMPIARIINDLVTHEIARQSISGDQGVIDAAVASMI